MKNIYVLLFDGYADWEIGYILPELRRMGNYNVISVGFTRMLVTSMGGLKLYPEVTVYDINYDRAALFIMPGGDIWEKAEYSDNIVRLVLEKLIENKIPVAAICAATLALIRAGILTGINHTSNSLEYVTTIIPAYSEFESYVNTLSIRDQGVITASGLGALEFAKNILDELNVSTPEIRAFWFEAFKSGKIPKQN